MKQKQIKKAFTLVELLIVIAIIGLLASLIMPAIANALSTANKATSTNAAKQIVTSWIRYKGDVVPPMLMTRTLYDWAARLAEKTDLNEPGLWLLNFDPAVAEKLSLGSAMPQYVAKQVGESGMWVVDPEFKAFPVSWEVANGIEPTASSKAPVIWTRGLKPDGTWDINDGVFGAKAAGNIGFVDGHVDWYTSLRDDRTRQGVLTVYGRTQRTYNIADAVRGGERNILRTKLSDVQSQY